MVVLTSIDVNLFEPGTSEKPGAAEGREDAELATIVPGQFELDSFGSFDDHLDVRVTCTRHQTRNRH